MTGLLAASIFAALAPGWIFFLGRSQKGDTAAVMVVAGLAIVGAVTVLGSLAWFLALGIVAVFS